MSPIAVEADCVAPVDPLDDRDLEPVAAETVLL
jgi:hypothetical protein